MWLSKLQKDIDLSTLHSEYVALFHYVRELTLLKSLIKEVIIKLGIDSDKLKFVPISTIYEVNNGSIVVATSPRMNPTSNHIFVKYPWFGQHVGKDFVILED